MRMLLRWFALLLCLTLAFPAALGESDTEALTALGYQLAQEEIDALLEDATGWSRVMLEDIQLGEVTVSKSSVTVYLTVPSLKSCLRSSVTLEDYAPKDYLAQAMADYLGHETREELKLNFTYKIKDGEITTKWSGVSNPRKLENSLASLSGTAKKSYNNKNTRAAIAAYLLPQAAQMPSREPDEMPAMASLAEYAAQVGPALGLTAQQAEGRLRCLMMMMDLTAMDTTEPLEATVLTLKVDDWATMLANAETLAQEAMAAAVGVPEMSEAELEAFLWDALAPGHAAPAVRPQGHHRGHPDRGPARGAESGAAKRHGADGLLRRLQRGSGRRHGAPGRLRRHAALLSPGGADSQRRTGGPGGGRGNARDL